MLKKAIKYTDFNGEEVTEDFYFNLTKAELIELEVGHEGGLSESLKRIVDAEDGGQIVKEFKEIILKAYGERSPDGKRFVKHRALRDQFESTEAYSELFVSLVTDPDAASEFISGIMPQDLMQDAQLAMETTPAKPVSMYEPPKEPRVITRAEAEEMDAAQLQSGLSSGALRFAPDEN